METIDDILISGLENVYQRGDTLWVYHKERLSLFNMDGKYSLAVLGEIGENIFILKATFEPKAVLNDRFLVDWEQPDNEDNPVQVLVEP